MECQLKTRGTEKNGKLSFCSRRTLRSLFIVYCLFAKKNYTNQIKSNYLNSHGEEAQEKPPGL